MNGEAQALVDSLLAFLAQDGCTDAEFDALALRLFAWQHANNEAYRRFCQRRGATPRTVKSWREIPAVPISAFKEATLSCLPAQDAQRVFMTSGTTRGDVKGRHYHPTLAVYDASMTRNFARRFMQGADRLPMAILFPTEEALPNSSLAHYLALAVQHFGAAESATFVSPQGMDGSGLRAWLRARVAAGAPCAVLGASYSFVHLMDELARDGERFALPPGSRLLDTGGYKGNSRELPLEAFYEALASNFGVPRERCINMYGMTELSTQLYDDGNVLVPSVKSGPHWIRSRLVDPLTGREVPAGERGVLAHTDLGNFNSATSILTEDVGVAAGAGFLLLGRAEGAQAKGCSLAVEEFLQANAA
ncbi:long-chain fatty acid--CoA ligase [Ramlibacter sp. XY19]|uniref:LuxE/PaaK family acyltransferase n=1 Tax=Ramlibacter paludis TaxID=2908000 RepID=UPI0023DABC6E|nr:long-chain fatty acid--CoA ligase [Ramlibacter paludis]MCG2591565.1 long-chain fatty acid--CoA ligase [Ramlibacter paludis]